MVLAQHILTLIHQPEKAGRGWQTTILNQRIAIAGLMDDSPSLKSSAEEVFAKAYADARKLAACETGLPVTTFPAAPPFSREQALSEAWHPETGPAA